MSGLPEPLVPIECKLMGTHGRPTPPMPIDVDQHLSSIYVTCWDDDLLTVSRVRLMAYAWTRRPAASIEDWDTARRVLRLHPAKWKRVEPALCADWLLCSDGRLYHPWLAEQALTAWRRLNARSRLDVGGAEWALLRLQTFRRDGFVCQYCDSRDGPFECDHVLPVAAGGPSHISNLITACKDCNRRKRSMPLSVFLADQPERLAAITARLPQMGGVA